MKSSPVSVQEGNSLSKSVSRNIAHPNSSAFLSPDRLPLVPRSQNISSTKKPLVQPRLKVGAANDKYEQEADRVADQVLLMAEPRQFSASGELSQTGNTNRGRGFIQRTCASCFANEALIQTKRTGGPISAHRFPAGIVPQSLQGGGRPLSGVERHFFEPRFGADFSAVRLHVGAQAATAARSLNARAFTLSDNIVFNTGEYASGVSGRRLLAHELTHVVQQGAAPQLPVGQRVRRTDAPLIQRDPAPATAATTTGANTADVIFLISNPSLEENEGLRMAINHLGSYSAHVSVDDVDFRILPASSQTTNLGAGLDSIDGRSHWEGSTPVVELTEALLNVATEHVNRSGEVSSDQLAQVHNLIRIIGHEMYHLWRAKEGHRGNPVQPVYDAEATRRMEQVRQNWLRDIREPGGVFGNRTRQDLGIAQDATINTWTDIDESVRTRIEQGAASTDYINGLYMRSAYLVEEIYTKIEELSFLRIQQHFEPDVPRTASRQGVSSQASLIYRLSNILDSMADPQGLITPALLVRTRTAMLAYLRSRYPNRSEPGKDSYEVIFYFTAVRGGLAPIYNDRGQVITVLPSDARPPVGRQ